MVGERLHHAGARNRQNPRRRPVIADVGHQRGVGAPAALQERREANADERRQIAASDLRCPVDRVILGRQPRERRAPPQRLEPLLEIRARLDCKRARVRLFRRLNIVAAVENLADLRERSRVGGIERDGPAEVPERLVQLPLLTLDRAKFAIEKRAVRRVAERLREPYDVRASLRRRAESSLFCFESGTSGVGPRS